MKHKTRKLLKEYNAYDIADMSNWTRVYVGNMTHVRSITMIDDGLEYRLGVCQLEGKKLVSVPHDDVYLTYKTGEDSIEIHVAEGED